MSDNNISGIVDSEAADINPLLQIASHNDDCLKEDKYTELTEQSLQRIEKNDPSITSLLWRDSNFNEPSIIPRRVGIAIGNNIHIKHLQCENFLDEAICRGIAKNRSITHLHLHEIHHLEVVSELISILFPFFGNNNKLCCLSLNACELGEAHPLFINAITTALTAALSTFNTLKLFDLGANSFTQDRAAEIINELRGHTNLNKINLSLNRLGKKGFLALVGVLKVCKVSDLDLGYCDIDDECATILVNALQKDTSLKKLCLDGQYAEFQDEQDIHITATGWGTLFSLLSRNLLEELSLYNTSFSLGNEEALVLAEYLTNNSTLKLLNLGENHNMGRTGWQAIFASLQTTALQSLDIRFNSNRNVPMRDLVRVLESPNCRLVCLYLYRNGLNDDEVIDIAQALAYNKCLKELGLDTEGSTITKSGWDALSAVLCNKSSFENTFSSNHTLEDGVYYGHDSVLGDLLDINKNNNASDAARIKIMRYHFAEESNDNENEMSSGIRTLSVMDWSILPHVMAWMGRKDDCEGHSTMYQLLRCIPELVEDQTQAKPALGKRKLGC